MATQSFKERHADAMLAPEGVDESILVDGFTLLTKAADRYKGDGVMIHAVEELGAVLVRFSGDGNNGRLDGGSYQKQVRDTVMRAGGNTDDI